MEQYRIKKHSYREEKTGEIVHYFTIEELVNVGWFKEKMKWIPLSIEVRIPFIDHSYREVISYDTKKEACAHLKRLKEKVPEDEIVTCAT